MSKKDDALQMALDWYDSGNENPDDFANMIKQVIALAQQPAQGCDYCNNPQYAGTKCKNCGREQPAQQQEPVAWAQRTQELLEVFDVDHPEVSGCCGVSPPASKPEDK